MTLQYVSGWTCREVHRVAKLSSRNVTPAFLYSIRQHAQKSMALSASSASVEVSLGLDVVYTRLITCASDARLPLWHSLFRPSALS